MHFEIYLIYYLSITHNSRTVTILVTIRRTPCSSLLLVSSSIYGFSRKIEYDTTAVAGSGSCKSIESFHVESRSVRLLSFPLVLAFTLFLPFASVRAHNVRFADQADLLRPTDKRTTDVPTYSETLREGGNSHAAARSSAMDRRVFPRSGERRGASGEGTFLFVQTRRSRVSRAPRSPFLLVLPFLGSIIHRATCAISCYEKNLALKKTNVRISNFREISRFDLHARTLSRKIFVIVYFSL